MRHERFCEVCRLFGVAVHLLVKISYGSECSDTRFNHFETSCMPGVKKNQADSFPLLYIPHILAHEMPRGLLIAYLEILVVRGNLNDFR